MQKMLGLLLLLTIFCGGCNNTEPVPDKPVIAVTSSWLESAVRDIAGDQYQIKLLLPPGSCPGHFDLSPKTLTELRRAQVMFCFDFQQTFSKRLKHLNIKTRAIQAPEGLCVPESYLSGCRAITATLMRHFPKHKDLFQQNLLSTEKRMRKLQQEIMCAMAEQQLTGTHVLSSGHQQKFCTWLGLQVVAQYSAADQSSFAEIQNIVQSSEQSEIKLVIANLQEGPQSAHALAQRLDVTVATISNFPAMTKTEPGFEQLVRNNVAIIQKALKP